MKIMIAVFIIIVAIILVGGHYGLFASWVWLFGIKSLAVKKALGITLGILSVSFIITAVLVHSRMVYRPGNCFNINNYLVKLVNRVKYR